ncbi:MAG: serine hydrolase domain-containing protein, partial [Saprospiraceae bacterium]
MKIKSLILVFLICLISNTTDLAAQNSVASNKSAPVINLPTATPESVGMSSTRLKTMEAKMHEYVDKGQLASVQTAVIRKGKVVQFDTYGYEDVDSKDPLKDNSIFRIYSMTKPIVSIGLMMLYEEGRFQLNDPLHKYAPEFKDMQVHIGDGKTEPAKQAIRIIDVLRHTTGFGYGWGFPPNHVDSLYKVGAKRAGTTNREFLRTMSTLPLYHQPGTGWRYSVSTDVAGALLEIIANQPLDEFLAERILHPLGMNDTHFEVPDAKDERFITNYTHKKTDGSLQTIDHPSMSKYCKEVTMFSGGGGLVSTTNDYLKFCQMLLNKGSLNGHQFVSPKTLELMTSDHTQKTPHAG